MDEEKILKVLKENDALKAGDISEKTGIDKNQVNKILKKLKEEEKIISPKRCFYSIK